MSPSTTAIVPYISTDDFVNREGEKIMRQNASSIQFAKIKIVFFAKLGEQYDQNQNLEYRRCVESRNPGHSLDTIGGFKVPLQEENFGMAQHVNYIDEYENGRLKTVHPHLIKEATIRNKLSPFLPVVIQNIIVAYLRSGIFHGVDF